MYKLLLVDDEPLIRRGIKSISSLSGIGIDEIFEAANGISALKLMHSQQIDIVFLDINMPDMDGLSLANNIKQDFPLTKVVIISGYDYFEYAQAAIRAGVDDYLLKPVSKKDIEPLLKKLAKSIDEDKLHKEIVKITTNAALVNPDLSHDNFKDISNYFDKHIFNCSFSLSLMAKELGFNSNYLSGVIKQIYGLNFQDYVSMKRMEQAKLLLLSSDMNNEQIALSVGYPDVNYFISKFKKIFKVSPKQFKQEVTG